MHWLENGDRNTKFFHQYASERRRRSRVRRIVLDDGRVVEDEEEMLEVVSNFYKDLFTARAGSSDDELLRHVVPRVTPEMNEALLREFTDEEIKQGLDGIGDLKAPGKDGMPALFYKNFWTTVGEDVTREVRNFLNGNSMPESWNDTVV